MSSLIPRPLPKLEEDINEHFRKQDEELMTPADQWDEYYKQYHQKLQYDDKNNIVGVSYIRLEEGMIKVDIYPISGDPETLNPLTLNGRCSDRSFYFVSEPHNPEDNL